MALIDALLMTRDGAERRTLEQLGCAVLRVSGGALPVPGDRRDVDDEASGADQHRDAEEWQEVELKQQRDRRSDNRNRPATGPGQREPEVVHLLELRHRLRAGDGRVALELDQKGRNLVEKPLNCRLCHAEEQQEDDGDPDRLVRP